MRCMFCKKGMILEEKKHYICLNCSIEGYIVDDFFYPKEKESYLCSLYSATQNLNTSLYEAGDRIQFSSARGKIFHATVLHVWKEKNHMIIRDEKKKIRILTYQKKIEKAFAELSLYDRILYKGWYNKKIEIIS